jgi:hypothetical protein
MNMNTRHRSGDFAALRSIDPEEVAPFLLSIEKE